MITANQWYNIARTTTIGAETGIRIDFGNKYALFKVSVDFGNAVITAVESNISPEETKISARIRYNNNTWYVDVRFSTVQNYTLTATVYDNTGWEVVSVNTSVAGNIICIINNLTSLIQPSTGGESLFERINVGTAENPVYAVVPKRYGEMDVGIISNTFMSMAGFQKPEDVPSIAISLLEDLQNVEIKDPKTGDVITFDEDLKMWINGPGGLNEIALGNYLVYNKYITQETLEIALKKYVTTTVFGEAIEEIETRLTPLEELIGKLFYYDEANNALRVKINLIVDGTIAMKDLGDGEGEEDQAGGYLNNLIDVVIVEPTAGDVLMYDEQLQEWVNKPLEVGLNKKELEEYLSEQEYIKGEDIYEEQEGVKLIKKTLLPKDLITQEELYETTEDGSKLIKKALIPPLNPIKGIMIDKSTLTIGLKVNTQTFGFNEDGELELLLVDGGIIEETN